MRLCVWLYLTKILDINLDIISLLLLINVFVPNATLLYPLKTLENLTVS